MADAMLAWQGQDFRCNGRRVAEIGKLGGVWSAYIPDRMPSPAKSKDDAKRTIEKYFRVAIT
jgi:hypothetical protein